MESLVGVFTSVPSAKVKKDDDFSDRLSSLYTIIILVVFAAVIGLSSWVGDPIKCWTPVHFTGNHIKYTNSYCWIRNTYYLPFTEEIPKPHEERQIIPYYQWITFILLGQAALFYFPSIVWHAMNQRGGVDADNLLSAANTFNSTEKVEHREATLRVIRNQLDRFLSSRTGVGKQSWKTFFVQRTFMGRRFGAYLTCLYLGTKLLYFLNAIGQLYILNYILSTNYSIYGIEVLMWMAKPQEERDWHNSPHDAFPRVTMCDFNIRRLGNLHRYTVQCTLPINLFNEKIYMFLWFWMLFVAIITFISFLTWLARACMRIDRIRYIQNHLKMAGRIETDQDKKDSEKFVRSYLRPDGVFLMRLIGHNTNSITATEIIAAMWDKWERPEVQPTLPAEDLDFGEEPPMELTPLTEPRKRNLYPEVPPKPTNRVPPKPPKKSSAPEDLEDLKPE